MPATNATPRASAPHPGDILQCLGRAVLAVDARLRVASVNGAARRLFALAPGLAPGHPLPDWPAEVSQRLTDCLESGQDQPPVCALISGRTLQLEIRPVLQEGRTAGAVITAREAAAAPDIPLRAVLDSVSEGIWICDGQGTILDINRESQRLNSIEASSYIGRNIRCIIEENLVDQSVTLDVLRYKRQFSILQYIS